MRHRTITPLIGDVTLAPGSPSMALAQIQDGLQTEVPFAVAVNGLPTVTVLACARPVAASSVKRAAAPR